MAGKQRFVKRRALKLAGAAAGSLAALAALKRLEALTIPSPDRFVGPHPEYAADVIVYRDGEYAVAVDSKGREIARSSDLAAVVERIQGEYPDGLKMGIGIGKFMVSSRIDITVDNVAIHGHGWSTVLELDGGVDDDMFHVTGDFFKLVGVRLKGNKTNNSSGNGVHLDGSLLPEVRGCYIEDFAGHGILVENQGVAIIVANRVVGNGVNGIRLGSLSDDSFIAFNDIGSNGYHGIGIGTVARVKVIGNNIYLNGWFGIDLYTASRNYVIGNTITDNAQSISVGAAIRIHGSSSDNGRGNIVIGNELHGRGETGNHGVMITGYANRNVVAGNTIVNVDVGVKEQDDADYNIIEGNIIYDTLGSKVLLVGDHSYADDHVYDVSSLPTDGFVLKKPVLAYDSGSGAYYIAVWDGSAWRKVQLS